MDTALKECMQLLCFVREEQEKRIHDAMMMTSRKFEKLINVLEEKLSETSKRISLLGAQNTKLSKALLAKEKVIKDLQEHRAKSEVDFSTLMTRLESTEKENASLRYEVRVVEKELEIRNEERDFDRQIAEVAHKQHLESVKNIAKLESECQKLRLLVRKRLPGPAALAKMKYEVEMLSRDPAEMRRRKSTSTVSMDFAVNAPCTLTQKINYSAEQLYSMEKENRTLKETLIGKTNGLQLSRSVCGSTASRLTEVEAQFVELTKGQTAAGLAVNLPTTHELSPISVSDTSSDEKFSCAESWASALISELEPLRTGKTGTPLFISCGASDKTLMDDFVEMEKLAIISSDKSLESSNLSSKGGNTVGGPQKAKSGGYISEATGGEIVTASSCHCDISVSNQVIRSESMLIYKIPGWMDDIVKVVLEQTRVTQRNPGEILEDIKVAMARIDHSNPNESFNPRKSLSYPDVSGCISSKPSDKSLIMYSPDRLTVDDTSLAEKSNKQFHSGLSKSVHKMIELVDGITLRSPHYGTPETLNWKADCSFPYNISEAPTGYMVRVFQWKTSDLDVVLQKFVGVCDDVLNGKAGLENFTEELTSTLEWIMNHCFSLQHVSGMRDAIKKHFDWDESRSESEIEGGMTNHFAEADKLQVPNVLDWKLYNSFSQVEELWSNVREESTRLKLGLTNTECEKELEGKLHAEISKNVSLMIQPGESEKTIEGLQAEVETLSRSKRIVGHQFEISKMVKEDHEIQLTSAKVELADDREKLSFLEEKLDNKNTSCEVSEATYLDLQLQLESMKNKVILKYDLEKEEKPLQNDLEITAASKKLAECQETILKLGRQFQAMASPRDASLFEKVISSPTDAVTTMNTTKKDNKKRASLLDKMLAEDNAETRCSRSPKTEEIICTSKSPTGVDGTCSAFNLDCIVNSPERLLNSNGIKHENGEAVINSLDNAPGKRTYGGGLLKRLFLRPKRGKSR